MKRLPPLLLVPLLSTAFLAACGPPPADAIVHVPGAQHALAHAPVTPSSEPAEAPPEPAGAIAWETSASVARERAKIRGAPLLVFVFAEWATAAVQMERTTWADPRVIRRARPFIALRLDVSAADANAQVSADVHDLRAIPAVVILDELGHEITRIEGHAGPDEVLAAMRRAMPGD